MPWLPQHVQAIKALDNCNTYTIADARGTLKWQMKARLLGITAFLIGNRLYCMLVDTHPSNN